mgnify:CR=1 FL=1
MKSYEEFRKDLGQRESGNNYKAVNTIGYLGRYQFGKPRLYDLGYSIDGWHPANMEPKTIITKEQFLNDTALQDELFDKHVDDLVKRIKKAINQEIIEKYTLSGLVAGAHLKGIGGVKEFIQGNDNADAYGTKISEYIIKFAGYDLENKKKV